MVHERTHHAVRIHQILGWGVSCYVEVIGREGQIVVNPQMLFGQCKMVKSVAKTIANLFHRTYVFVVATSVRSSEGGIHIAKAVIEINPSSS